MKKRRYFLLLVLALCFSVPLIAAAQTQTQPTFVPLASEPGGQLNQLYSNTSGLSGYINIMFTIALSVGAMLAVLRLVYAGYIYMLKDSFSMKQNAKEIIGNTVFGLLLLLAIYLILFQINPCILNLNFLNDFSGTTTSTCPTS